MNAVSRKGPFVPVCTGGLFVGMRLITLWAVCVAGSWVLPITFCVPPLPLVARWVTLVLTTTRRLVSTGRVCSAQQHISSSAPLGTMSLHYLARRQIASEGTVHGVGLQPPPVTECAAAAFGAAGVADWQCVSLRMLPQWCVLLIRRSCNMRTVWYNVACCVACDFT